MKYLLTVALFVLGTACAQADESAVRLKEDANRNLVIGNCVGCHSLDYIPMNSVFLDRKGWEATVAKMINAMGAQIRKEDVPVIVDYLTRNYGK